MPRTDVSSNWGTPMPEDVADWSLFDITVIVVLTLALVVIGVVTAGGPN